MPFDYHNQAKESSFFPDKRPSVAISYRPPHIVPSDTPQFRIVPADNNRRHHHDILGVAVHRNHDNAVVAAKDLFSVAENHFYCSEFVAYEPRL
jgi:hypothetical protein